MEHFFSSGRKTVKVRWGWQGSKADRASKFRRAGQQAQGGRAMEWKAWQQGQWSAGLAKCRVAVMAEALGCGIGVASHGTRFEKALLRSGGTESEVVAQRWWHRADTATHPGPLLQPP